MDHEYKDVEMMDLDDPMEVTTSLLPSSFILAPTITNWAPLILQLKRQYPITAILYSKPWTPCP